MFLLEGEEEGDDERKDKRKKNNDSNNSSVTISKGKNCLQVCACPAQEMGKGGGGTGAWRGRALVFDTCSQPKGSVRCVRSFNIAYNPYRIGCRCRYSPFTDQG